MVPSSTTRSLPMFEDPAGEVVEMPSRQAAPPPDGDVRSQAAAPPATSGIPFRGDAAASQLLALGHAKGIGVSALRGLLDFYGDLARVWEDDSAAVHDVLGRSRVAASGEVAVALRARRRELLDEGNRTFEDLRRHGVRVLLRDDAEFPEQLRSIADGPYWLFVEGDPLVLSAVPLVAIVGTRSASPIGTKTAERLSAFVCMEGLGVISGLAEGIDAAAHRAAALYNVRQVGVLGTGIRSIFPASTAGLRRRIVEHGGAMITEYLPDDRWAKAHFVQRDRIQAALAVAVSPVEGRAKSGTAHTVRFAELYQRPLFGVRRGEVAPDNVMPALLAERGRPVFDLDEDGGALMRAYLHDLPGPRWPDPPQRPEPAFLFREALRSIDELGADVALNPFLGRWLIEELAKRFGLPVRFGGPENGD